MSGGAVATSTRLGITVPYTDALPRSQVVEFVELADRLGYESVWVPEAYGYDAFTMLTLLATRTTTIQLATGIVNVFSRSPALLAQTVAALDDISSGRAILGLGTSGPQVITGWHGIPFDKPLQRVRETVEVVRTVLRRDRLRHQGAVFTMTAGLKLITHPPRPAVPIALASITEAGAALAAEVADRWMPTLFDPEAAPGLFAAALGRGAARRDPGLGPLLTCPTVQVCIDDDIAAARDQLRPGLALYIGGMGTREKNFYNALVSRYGYAEEARHIQDLYLGGEREAAIAAVPDELIDRVALVGPLERCRQRLGAIIAAGWVPLLSFANADPGTRLVALEALAPAAPAPAR